MFERPTIASTHDVPVNKRMELVTPALNQLAIEDARYEQLKSDVGEGGRWDSSLQMQGERLKQKREDIKNIDKLLEKREKGESFTKEELAFIYEVHSPIRGASREMTAELIKERDVKEDIAFTLDISKEEVSTTREEALGGEILFHYGDLDLSDITTAENLVLPRATNGGINLVNLVSGDNLVLPEYVGGDINLRRLSTAKNLVFPKHVGGSLGLSLTSVEGLTLPETVGGDLYLSKLPTAKDLVLPRSIGKNLLLTGLVSGDDLVLPQMVGGQVRLNSGNVGFSDIERRYPKLLIIG